MLLGTVVLLVVGNCCSPSCGGAVVGNGCWELLSGTVVVNCCWEVFFFFLSGIGVGNCSSSCCWELLFFLLLGTVVLRVVGNC